MILIKGGGKKMYNPVSWCSAFVHLLIKHPILAVGLGLAAAANFLSPQLLDRLVPEVERSAVFRAKIQKLEADPMISELAKQSEPAFRAIIAVAAEKRTSIPGTVAEETEIIVQDFYGPAGITRMALEDVLLKIPACQNLGYDKVRNDPELSAELAYLYFLDLIHVGLNKDAETAVKTYNYGPIRVKGATEEGQGASLR